MAFLVPDNSGTLALTRTTGGTSYGLIGPIPKGRYIERIDVFAWSAGGPAVRTAFALGISAAATQAGLQAGTSLVQRSDANIGGVPAVETTIVAEAGQAFVVWVGRRVDAGPSWIVVGMNTGAAGKTSWIVSAKVLGIARERRLRVGELEEFVLP